MTFRWSAKLLVHKCISTLGRGGCHLRSETAKPTNCNECNNDTPSALHGVLSRNWDRRTECGWWVVEAICCWKPRIAKCPVTSAAGSDMDEVYCFVDVSRRKTNSCRTLMAALVPRAIPAFSKVSRAPWRSLSGIYRFERAPAASSPKTEE